MFSLSLGMVTHSLGVREEMNRRLRKRVGRKWVETYSVLGKLSISHFPLLQPLLCKYETLEGQGGYRRSV